MKLLTSLHNKHHYRLLQLTPELTDALENNQLTVKSSGPELVLCTTEKTYRVRQMNQSNTLLLTVPCGEIETGVQKDVDGGAGGLLNQSDDTDDTNTNIVAFGSASNFLEPCEMTNVMLDTTIIPLYLGDGGFQMSESSRVPLSLADLRMNSPMSDLEFDKEWSKLGGVEIQTPAGLPIAAIPDDNTVRGVLTEVLTSMVTQVSDWKTGTIDYILDKITPEDDGEPPHVTKCIMKRFSNSAGGLNMDLISSFYGIQTLHSLGKKTTTKRAFLELWTRNIPVAIGTELSLSLLSGHHMCPTEETICFFSERNLSTNPKIRFNQILAAKPLWEMNEILPFIEPVRHNKSVKMENFVMKYAKRRRVGKRILISET